MVIKYRIKSSVKNNNLVNDVIELEKVKAKTLTIKSTKRNKKSIKDILIEFIDKQEKFNKKQDKFNRKQEELNKFIMKQFKVHGWTK